jgi:hypothetical protein
LDDRFEKLSLGQSLQQRDLVRQRRNGSFLENGELDFVSIRTLYLADEFVPGAVKHGDLLPRFYAQDMQGMVGLSACQEERWLIALIRREIKARHGIGFQ